jgi:hypothetical protein
MKRLVLIHGRSQQDIAPEELKALWLESLHKGLENLGLSMPAVETICFPYYGDTLVQLCNGRAQDTAARIVLRGEVDDITEQFFYREILLEIAEQWQLSEADVIRNRQFNEVSRGLQNWPVTLVLARLLSQIPGVDMNTIALVTHDVFCYLSQPGISAHINRGVQEAFTRECDNVVVSHSLGTVVAYNVLRMLDNTYRASHLITLGSPLAIGAIRNMLAPLTRAGRVEEWSNARDPKDIVALFPLAPPRFPLAEIVNRSDVHNFTADHHGIAGYLEDPGVARWIHDALLPCKTDKRANAKT